MPWWRQPLAKKQATDATAAESTAEEAPPSEGVQHAADSETEKMRCRLLSMAGGGKDYEAVRNAAREVASAGVMLTALVVKAAAAMGHKLQGKWKGRTNLGLTAFLLSPGVSPDLSL